MPRPYDPRARGSGRVGRCVPRARRAFAPPPADQTIGEWQVDEDGNGTLSAPDPLGARYALQAGTMSIRQVQHDFSTATALPVNPLSYSLVACGEVQRIEVLDPVTNLVPRLPSLPSVPPLS